MIPALGAALMLLLAGPLAAQEAASGTGAVLRGLDKVDGTTFDMEIPSGRAGNMFGMFVAVRDCRFPAGNPTGDAFAYLEIREQPDAPVLFEGWMIASSPALNALDHSRYDIWVLRCKTS